MDETTEAGVPAAGRPDETTTTVPPAGAAPDPPALDPTTPDVTTPDATTMPAVLRRSVDLWWCAVAIGIVTTTVQLVSGRVRAGVGITGTSGAQVAVEVVGAVLVGLVAVAYWAVQAWSIRRLAAGRRWSRILLTVLGAVSVVVDAGSIAFAGSALPAGVAVAILSGLHLLVVVVAVVLMYRPAVGAHLPAREQAVSLRGRAVPPGEVRRDATTVAVEPARRGRRGGVLAALVVAGVLLLVVEIAAALTGVTRVGVENAVSEGLAAEAGGAPVPVSCGWAAGLASLADDVTGETCTTELAGRPVLVGLTSRGPLQISYAVDHVLNLRKIEATLRRNYAERGRRVNVACSSPGGGIVVPVSVGTQLSCSTTDVAGAHTQVVARVTDERDDLSFTEVAPR